MFGTLPRHLSSQECLMASADQPATPGATVAFYLRHVV
jgi:hypothetical protein